MPFEARKRENPNTYIVQDRENQQELVRLTLQDQLLTASMGGVLAEQSNSATLRHVLDIGCATGGWAIETALAYPEIKLVIGIDISQRMITYARQMAEAQQVTQRVEFHVMDALRMLEFPDRFFDLVNIRLGGSWLRTWDWPKLLNETLRIIRPGGIARITEQKIMHQSSSNAQMRINQMALKAFYRAGYLFTEESTGLTMRLPQLLARHGFSQVKTVAHVLEYHAGTPACKDYIDNLASASRTLRPFLQKWGTISEGYDELCQQFVTEGQSPDFHATWSFQTVWGVK